jgi:hypothetical protein
MDVNYTPALRELKRCMDSLLETDKIARTRKKPVIEEETDSELKAKKKVSKKVSFIKRPTL